jgi:hypothetical protein
LRLAPINIFEDRGQACGHFICPPVRSSVFNNAIDIADDANAIVNLSVGRQVPFTEISGALRSRGDVLFVVAAGNDQSSLDNRRVYPASYGGNNEGQHNLITVAAIDFNGTRAAFSNYGSNYVDIAAPGCRQAVFERDPDTSGYRETQASGTSFAAPQVSFTAALLRAIWPYASPGKLKSRILSGADISPDLPATEVAGSRVLNVSKTLAVYQDVVDARINGEFHRIRGWIDPKYGTFSLCGGSLNLQRNSGPSFNRVRKIAKITQPPGGLRVDWENYNGVFKTQDCPLQDTSIAITEAFTRVHYEIPGDQVIDIVFAEPR